MLTLTEITDYTNDYLHVSNFNDYCPNGLQVQGKMQISKIASAVTASLAVIQQAAQWGADCLLVHHGYFWKNESAVIVGMKQQRLKALLASDMSLLAYHLPLDAHPEVGNNAQIAQKLNILNVEPLQKFSKNSVGNVGLLETRMEINQFVAQCSQLLKREVIHINTGPEKVQRIAWCTGGAQHMISDAVESDADVYLTGEISEQTVHIARECGIHFIAAGHHATERYGVQALAEHLVQKFGLQARFFDEINPA